MVLPVHVPEQIALYQGDYLMTHAVCRFDPAQAARRMRIEQRVLAIDLGGDKLRWATYAIRDGKLAKLEEATFQSTGGVGYLSLLEELSRKAIADDVQVGISSATKLAGSVIQRTVNLPQFFKEFRNGYDADYERLFPGRSIVVNDTVAGICGASTHLALDGQSVGDVAFFICGSGLGASVIRDCTAIHVEAAHVPLATSLNPLGQTTPCSVEGRDFVCVERVTAARAGIEELYFRQTGEAKDGVSLAAMYEAGDRLPTLLYETSALALAHAVVGVMERFALPNTDESVVVLHGGNFEVATYRDAITRNLEALPRSRARIVFSRDLSENVCLDGAGVLAACSETSDFPATPT